MGAQHEEAQHLEVVFLTDLADREEIPQGFGHLLIVNIQKSIVHPVSGEGLAVGRLALGDLVLVVREDQILAAGVNVDLLAQIFLGHHGALDVPAGTALAPVGLPVGLALLLRLPEHEVGRVALALLTGDFQLTETGLQVVQVLVGQLPVLLKGCGAEIDGSVLGHVGVPLVDQGLDHIQHAADLLGGQRVRRGRLDV